MTNPLAENPFEGAEPPEPPEVPAYLQERFEFVIAITEAFSSLGVPTREALAAAVAIVTAPK